MFSQRAAMMSRAVIPTIPVHLMRTFAINQPIATHYRRAWCEEVDCPKWKNGFTLGFDLTNQEHVDAANLIRMKSGRAFTVKHLGTNVELTFPPGQRCFGIHRVHNERDPFLIVRGGDFRGSTGERFQHTSAESFVDHWATDLDKLTTEHQKGW